MLQVHALCKLTTTDSPDMVRVINNINPFEEVKFEMRAIFWAMVSICEKFDNLMLEDSESSPSEWNCLTH